MLPDKCSGGGVGCQYGFKICFLRAAQRVHRGGGAVVMRL